VGLRPFSTFAAGFTHNNSIRLPCLGGIYGIVVRFLCIRPVGKKRSLTYCKTVFVMRKRISTGRVASSSPEGGVWLAWPELDAALKEAEVAVQKEKTAAGRCACYMAMGELCYRSGTDFRAVHCWEKALQACFDADYASLSYDHREQARYVAEHIDRVRRHHGISRAAHTAKREVYLTYLDISYLRRGE